MIAAIVASKQGNKVTLIEKNECLGRKVRITGKGRCNLTFEGELEDFKKNIVKNYTFMYSSFSGFDNHDVISFFKKIGVKTKIERGARVFPVSDDANEVVSALLKELKKNIPIIL